MRWQTKTIDELCAIAKGKKLQEVSEPSHSYRYIQIDDLHGQSFTKYTKEHGTECTIKDVLIAWDGANAGKVGVGLSGMIGSTLARLRPKNSEVVPQYLYWFLESKFDLIKSTRTGATIPHVNGTTLRQIKVPLPPLSVQKQIADTLDKADALRKKDQQLLKKYDELAQAIFYEMFDNLNRNKHGWRVMELQEVVHKDRIITYGIVQAGPHVDDGVPYIKTGDIKDGKIIGPLSRTSPEIATAYKRSEVKKGDIVISIRATVGTLALLPDELDGANLTQGTARISPGELVNRMFLYYYLKSDDVQNWIQAQVKGATFREITLGRLRTLPVVVPKLEVQKKFEKAVSHIRKQHEMISTQLQNSSLLFQTVLSQSFSG